MAACNVDSRLFIGAVSRVICEPHVVVQQDTAVCIKLIALLPGATVDDAVLQRYAERVRQLSGLHGLVVYRVLQQGAAPNSTILHLPVSVSGIVEVAFASLVDLECALVAVADKDLPAAHFVVEEHRLAGNG